MTFTVNEIGTLTIEQTGGFSGNYATGWSAANYYHITDLDTAGSAQLHSFVVFYKGTQTDAGSNGELAIPLFGDKDNTGGITLGIDGGYLAISDGTTISRGSTLINDDVWHPIIFSVGNTTVKGYADGVLEVDVTPSNLSTVIINAIGNSAGATAYPTALDGIQIYNLFLQPSMVAEFQANIYAPEAIDDPINDISGIIARYTPDSFNTSTGEWEDTIGSNNATTSRGTVATKNTALGGYKVLYGGTGDGLLFPTSILPSTYTLFHVTRYSGGTEKRILIGNGGNWLSGHWDGNAGVAFHNGWLTSQTDYNGTDWSIYTDQNSLFRDAGTVRGTSGGNASTRLGINSGDYTEYSDWECAEIIVFNRLLSTSEIETVEDTLGWYYPNAGITSSFGARSGSSSSSSSNFIIDPIIISQQQTHETVNTTVPINTDFVPIVVQTNDSMAIMEAQLGNTTLEDDIIFTKVYMNHELNNEEDKMNHRVQVVVPFAVAQKSREKWS